MLWIDARDKVEAAKLKGFKCNIDYYDFIDLEDEELERWHKEAKKFLETGRELSQGEETAKELTPGFYLELDGDIVAGPFKTYEQAHMGRVAICAPPEPDPRADEWEWARGGSRYMSYEDIKSLRKMNWYKIREVK